jgi:ABC-2 type transport system ATP-binding protein
MAWQGFDVIEIERLGKVFGHRTAVEEITFRARPGEVIGLLGPNGAGKTTTLRMITGYIAPSHGRATIYGHDMARAPLPAQRMLGYLPEGAPSYGDMTVLAFLRFIASVRGLRGRTRRERIDLMVAQLSLEAVLAQRIDTLSKGFKRRVGLAQALVHDPAVLVLDEPTDGLDPNQKRLVRELITAIASDKIILVSTHILEEVDALCTRALVIANGRLVADDEPAALAARSRYRGAVTLTLVNIGSTSPQGKGSNTSAQGREVSAQLEALPGVARVERDPRIDGRVTVFPAPGARIVPPVLATIQGQGWQVAELHTEDGRLDDVFHRLTTEHNQAMVG